MKTGERGGRPRISDSLTTPCVMTSTYTFKDTAELIAYQEGTYGRAVQVDPGFSQLTPRLLSGTFRNFQLLKLKHG